jgi:hypothetical protein
VKHHLDNHDDAKARVLLPGRTRLLLHVHHRTSPRVPKIFGPIRTGTSASTQRFPGYFARGRWECKFRFEARIVSTCTNTDLQPPHSRLAAHIRLNLLYLGFDRNTVRCSSPGTNVHSPTRRKTLLVPRTPLRKKTPATKLSKLMKKMMMRRIRRRMKRKTRKTSPSEDVSVLSPPCL